MLTNHKSLIITTYTKPASINLFSIGKRHFFSIRFPKTTKSIEETIAPNNDNIRLQLFKNLLEGHDGVKNGYANEALSTLADLLTIPVIASGGAGCMEHFRDTFAKGKADAALAASVFHFGEIKIPELKSYLCVEGITIR